LEVRLHFPRWEESHPGKRLGRSAIKLLSPGATLPVRREAEGRGLKRVDNSAPLIHGSSAAESLQEGRITLYVAGAPPGDGTAKAGGRVGDRLPVIGGKGPARARHPPLSSRARLSATK